METTTPCLYNIYSLKKKRISVPYQDEKKEFDVWTRPIWTWCEGLLNDKEIVSKFQWDAEKIFKYNGEKFERWIDEPWTADAWWEFQVINFF